MSTIKVDAITTRTGSGNITLGNSLINRTGDGTVLTLQAGGTTFGTIGQDGSDLVIDGPSGHTGLRMTTSGLLPRQNSAIIDNTIQLGSTGYRFKDLFLGGGLYVGGTGAANKLDDYEEGTWVPVVKSTSGGSTYTYSSDYEFRLPGATSSVNAIPYTKIGNRVFITFSIWWNTAANTRFNIDLPFAYDGSPYGLAGNATPYSIAANQGLGILGTTNDAQNFDTYTITSSGGHGNVNYPTNGEIYYFICYQTA